MAKCDYTVTEQAMLDVLSDGKEHSKEEIRRCLPDDLSDNIKSHLYNLRRKIRSGGRDIVCLSKGRQRPVRYQLVKLLYVTVE